MENKETEPKPNPAENVFHLTEQLGFIESDELILQRSRVIEVMKSGCDEQIKELVTRYHLLGQEIVNQQQGPNFVRAQLGFMITMGNIRREAGRWDAYVDDLQDALDFSYGMEFHDIIPVIEQSLDFAIEQLFQY